MESRTYQCKQCGGNTSSWSAVCSECHDIRIRRARLIEQYAGQIYNRVFSESSSTLSVPRCVEITIAEATTLADAVIKTSEAQKDE